MNLMLELPGGKYFAVPREALKKYSVSKEAFEKELEEKLRTGNHVFAQVADVEGQEDPPPPPPIRTRSVAMGVRG